MTPKPLTVDAVGVLDQRPVHPLLDEAAQLDIFLMESSEAVHEPGYAVWILFEAVYSFVVLNLGYSLDPALELFLDFAKIRRRDGRS